MVKYMPTDEKKKRILQKQDCAGYYLGFCNRKTRPFFGPFHIQPYLDKIFVEIYHQTGRTFLRGWNENS